MKRSILIILGLSVILLAADFIRVKSGVVADFRTGLTWQDDVKSRQMLWREAINYCENLTLNGSSDWRLPNINELNSILDYTKNDPSIYSVFLNTITGEDTNSAHYYYWSSTSYFEAKKRDFAWAIGFVYGGQEKKDKFKSYNEIEDNKTKKIYKEIYYVRCVRSDK